MKRSWQFPDTPLLSPKQLPTSQPLTVLFGALKPNFNLMEEGKSRDGVCDSAYDKLRRPRGGELPAAQPLWPLLFLPLPTSNTTLLSTACVVSDQRQHTFPSHSLWTILFIIQ